MDVLCALSSESSGRGLLMAVCLITGVVSLDHLMQVVSVGFSTIKLLSDLL